MSFQLALQEELDKHAATALTADAASVISIQPCQQPQAAGFWSCNREMMCVLSLCVHRRLVSHGVETADGVLTTWLRRRNGCARVATESFALLPDGFAHIYSGKVELNGPGLQPSAGCCTLLIMAPVPDLMSACLLAEAVRLHFSGSLQTAGDSRPHNTPKPPVLVGMKHELSTAERKAHRFALLPTDYV